MEMCWLQALKHSVHGLLEGLMSECHLISQGNWISELPLLMVVLSCYSVASRFSLPASAAHSFVYQQMACLHYSSDDYVHPSLSLLIVWTNRLVSGCQFKTNTWRHKTFFSSVT